eukprot:6484668-Pyramimonas_sp.AAC.1
MAEAVDPTAADPSGYVSDYSDALSAVMGATYETDAPLVTKDMDLSPGRRVVHCAGSVGWVKTIIKRKFRSGKL